MACFDRLTLIYLFIFLMMITGLFFIIKFKIKKKTTNEFTDFAEISFPLNPLSFKSLFYSPHLRFSQDGKHLSNCEFIENTLTEKRSLSLYPLPEKDKDEEVCQLNLLGIVSVIRSFPKTWLRVYYQQEKNMYCYIIVVKDTRSSLVCYKEEDLMALIDEIDLTCGEFSQVSGWKIS
jgi:hypothetical protein